MTGALRDALIELGGGFDRIDLAETGNSIFARGVEDLDGGNGDDTVVLLDPATGTRVLLRGGNDRLVLADGTNNIRINNIETVIGGSGNDEITTVTRLAAFLRT